MRVGSLFSGIGGLDLGLERAGMTVVWQSEIDPYASRVLAKHWPDVPNLGDITTIDWSGVEPVDLICGGYPCQPFSLAGARAGTNDARHLWPYFADAIRHLRPSWAVLENVPGHLSMGFGDVLADLAGLRYDTEWDCIPAAAVGAPHLRYRVFVVAHANEQQHEGDTPSQRRAPASVLPAHANSEGEPGEPVDAFTRSRVMVPDTNGERVRIESVGVTRGSGTSVALDDREELADTAGPRFAHVQGGTTLFERAGRGTVDGAGWWDTEPAVGRVADGVPSRVDRLKCLGNAVVPQVAEWVGRRIMEAA